ncbi:MAG: hypothetical protein SF182_00080, partial [Deltaproteobacteria bacterium]|nr:hypothetical protein [Deltaproteobacteria bacterium]
MARQAARRWVAVVAAVVALSAGAAVAAHAEPPLPAGVEQVRGLEIAPLRPGAAVLRVRFAAFGRNFELLLAPLRNAGADGAPVYRGRLRGDRGRAWLVVRGDTLDGVIETADGSIGVAPATRLGLDAAHGTVAYRIAA